MCGGAQRVGSNAGLGTRRTSTNSATGDGTPRMKTTLIMVVQRPAAARNGVLVRTGIQVSSGDLSIDSLRLTTNLKLYARDLWRQQVQFLSLSR